MPKAQTAIKWKHYLYEYWEQHVDKYYTKIEDHGKYGGYNIKISVDSSGRGANCMEDEIDGLIDALKAAKQQVADLHKAALPNQENKG